MLWCGRARVAILCATVASCGFAFAGEKPETEKSDAIKVPIPVGQDAMGLKIPLYNGKGDLTMTLEMERAEKIDESRMRMDGAEVRTFDEDGAPDLRISLPSSVIDLETRVVTSEVPVTIEREDFSLTGDTMEFHLKERSGRLTGQIRMLIYDRNRISPAKSARN